MTLIDYSGVLDYDHGGLIFTCWQKKSSLDVKLLI